MDGSGRRHLPLEWYPGPYGYDPYTNTLLPLTGYAGWNVGYSWNIPPDHYQGHIQHLSPYSRGVPLGNRRGRGRRRSSFIPARQHGGRGLLGSDPSRHRPYLPPPRRRRASAEDQSSSSQTPVVPPVQPPVPAVPPPPPAPASVSSSAGRSPTTSHPMAPPVSYPTKNSDVVDVTMADAAAKPKRDGSQGGDVLLASLSGSTTVTKKKRSSLVSVGPPTPLMKNTDVVDVTITDAASKPNKRDGAQDDLLVAAGLSGSSTITKKKRSSVPVSPAPPLLKNSDVVNVTMTDSAAKPKKDGADGDVFVTGLSGSSTSTGKKRMLVPVGPPPPLSDVDMSSMDSKDDGQGDVLGLNVFMAKKRLLSKKASRLAVAAEEEAAANKDSSNKKSRLGWGQGLAKYEKKGFKKDDDDDDTHTLPVAEGGASGEPSPPPGRKGHGNDHNKVAEMRVSEVTTAPESSKMSSPLTGSKGYGDHISMAEKIVSQVTTAPTFSKGCSTLTASKGHGDRMAEMRVSQVTTASAFCKVSCPLTASEGHGDHNNMVEMRASQVSTAPAFCNVSCPLTGKGHGDHSIVETRVSQVTTAPKYSKGSCPLRGCKVHGDHNNKAEMRVSQVTTAHAFSKRSSPLTESKDYGDRNSIVTKMTISQVTTEATFSKESSPLTGNLGDPGNGSTSRLTKNVDCPVEVPGFSRKHSPSTAALGGSSSSLMSIPGKVVCSATDVVPSSSQGRRTSRPPGDIGDRGNTSMNLTAEVPHAISRKEDNSDSCIRSSTNMTAMVASDQLASSQRCDPPPGDSSNNNNENSLRSEKVVVIFAPKPKKVLDKNVLSDDEEPQTYELHNENDAAPLLSGKATVRATKNCGRISTEAEDVKKPVNQICHESTANHHRLSDKGHGESSMDENEHETGEVLVGESNAAPSPLGMRSNQAPVLENLNKDSCSIEAICTTKSSSKVKENVTQSVLIANHGDEGNCVAGGSCGQQDTLEIMSLPDKSCAKLANGTIKGDQIRSGAKTPEPCPSLKECNAAAKHHSWKATEKKVANTNVDDSRKALSDMKNPNSEDNPCITSDPAATLTGPAFVQHMMKEDQKMERDSQQNEDKTNKKEGNNPVLCVASKEGGGIQMSCEVNSHKVIEKVDSIPNPEGNYLNADMENPTRDSGPCVASDAAVVIDDGLIQRLRASEAMYEDDKDAKVKSMEGNPAHSFASKEWSSMQSSCHVTSRKGKEKVDIIPSPEVYDRNAPTMQMSNDEAPKTYHLPSSYGSSHTVHASSSHVEMMDIDLNVPLDVTPLDVTPVDLENSDAKATMGPNNGPGEETDSDATMEDIRPSQTIDIPQTAHRLPANQPGSIRLFGRVIYQSPSTRTTTHFPNQGNQIVFSSSNTLPSSSAVPVTRPRGGQIYPPSRATTANSIWRSIFPNNQEGQQALFSSNRISYGGGSGSASGAAAASPLQQLHQHMTTNALVNITVQQRQQVLASMTPNSIMRGAVPAMPSNLVPGSNGGGGGFINVNGFNSVQQQWPLPVLDTSRVMFGYPYPSYYFPTGTTTTGNQAPAAVSTMPSTSGTNNGEGASTSNTRAPAPPAAGRVRDPNSWLSLDRNN